MKKILVIFTSLIILFVLSFFCSYGVYKKSHDYSDEILNSTENQENEAEINEEPAVAVQNNSDETSETEETETTTEASDYNFLVGELNGYIAVYTYTGSLYEFTDIELSSLDSSLRERIKTGIKFQKAKEMFTFLESCSS